MLHNIQYCSVNFEGQMQLRICHFEEESMLWCGLLLLPEKCHQLFVSVKKAKLIWLLMESFLTLSSVLGRAKILITGCIFLRLRLLEMWHSI